MTPSGAPVRVLFLAGMGRSGTTLLERALAGVEGALALGEVMHLWRRGVVDDELCGCGSAFSSCPFWKQVGTTAFGTWAAVDVGEIERQRDTLDRVRHVPELLVRRGARRSADQKEYADRYLRLYRAAQNLTGAQVVIDSSKQASLPHLLSGRPDIDLRVLHVVRDPRAVAHAWAKEVVRPEATSPSLMPRYDPRTMALMWSRHNVAVELLRVQGLPVLRLRYEDFLEDAPAALARVARFADLPSDPAALNHLTKDSVSLSLDHTAAGNPMRFSVGVLALRRDDAWQAQMSMVDRRAVVRRTWPLLRRYGYHAASAPR